MRLTVYDLLVSLLYYCNLRTDGRTDGQTEEETDGCMDVWIHGCKDVGRWGTTGRQRLVINERRTEYEKVCKSS